MVPNKIQPPIHGIGSNRSPASDCERPVFVIGAPRSGTTVLALSLARHSQLWTSDESQVLWDLFEGGRLEKNYQRQARYDGSWLCKQSIKKEEFLAFLGVGLNALFTSRSEGKRWVDQTPVYAFWPTTWHTCSQAPSSSTCSATAGRSCTQWSISDTFPRARPPGSNPEKP